ncbi:MAG: sugar ABC transporter substrate-binding protein [Oscillospiraceae bacterium]
MKRFLAITLCIVMLLTLAACGTKPAEPTVAPTDAGTSAPVEKPFDGQTIRVILASHDWTKAIEPKLAEFTEKTGIEVEFEVYPEDQLSTKLNVELASGGQYIDVFMCRPLQEVQQFIQNGYLAPMTDVMADEAFDAADFITAAKDSYLYAGSDDGIYYGVPLVTERQVLYYRTDLLEKAGVAVPTNLEELTAAAEALNDPANNVVGFVGRGLANAAVTQFSTYLYSFGGDFIDFTTNTATINTPEAIEAFTYYGDLLRNYGPEGALNMHWQQAAAIYSTGGAAFCTDADAIWQSFCGPETDVGDVAGFALSPTNATWNICSWGLGISAGSPNQAAAAEFVKWAAGVDMTKFIQTAAISSARNSAWNDPACTSNYPAELLAAIQAGNEIATKSYDRPLTTSVSASRDVIGSVITTAIEGGDVKAAADAANVQFQAILDADKAALAG